MDASSVSPTRPQHRRNVSSRSNVFRALVSPRRPDASSTQPPLKSQARMETVPLLPPDHPHAAKGQVLGERQGNMRSPPSSPSKSRRIVKASSKTSSDLAVATFGSMMSHEKSKSSTNLVGMLGKKNRSDRDVSQQAQKDKENTTPPSSSDGPVNTPIWAQFATAKESRSRPGTSDSHKSDDIQNEIAKYTPHEYSPSKQRNFIAGMEHPQLRPTLQCRPKSMYTTAGEVTSAMGCKAETDNVTSHGRKSEDLRRPNVERKPSCGSMEHPPLKDKLNITKRGGRVMAAVAALQGKAKDPVVISKDDAPLDPKIVDEAFEAVLELRNVPEPVRRKMRSLTLPVKADFVKQNQEASKPNPNSPTGTLDETAEATTTRKLTKSVRSESEPHEDDDSRSTKRSRARSRPFTFTKGDKGSNGSPSKRQRSSSKSRSNTSQQDVVDHAGTPITPRSSMYKRRSGAPAVPADYIKYLRSNQDPVVVEVGRLHKLRILLRNETVAWVDAFVSMGGMTEIVGLLYRIMGIEWREEHEDQLLHETLLCLKGLCTTERAMGELEKVTDVLFPKLLAMLFDDEKKGPAEYSTRAIITIILFNFLTSALTCSPEALEQRARKILTYLADPVKPEDERPLNFVLDMRISRPYKLWCREITHVTKEVFWIFLHHLNVIPLPKKYADDSSLDSSILNTDTEERAKVLAVTYSQRHFPGSRPPVPAAPYIGGVEWDATTYITAHLDLLNGVIASIPSSAARNALRSELQASGFEKVLGTTLRTCKEKFYAGVHDGLRAWVAAAAEDGWETRFVREGPTQEEQARSYSPKKSPKKKDVAPKLDLHIPIEAEKRGGEDDDDGWLG